jgi:hypothetical protein
MLRTQNYIFFPYIERILFNSAMKQTDTIMLAICIGLGVMLMILAATGNAQGRGSKSSERWCIKIEEHWERLADTLLT